MHRCENDAPMTYIQNEKEGGVCVCDSSSTRTITRKNDMEIYRVVRMMINERQVMVIHCCLMHQTVVVSWCVDEKCLFVLPRCGKGYVYADINPAVLKANRFPACEGD